MAEEQNRDIKSYPTRELVEELKHREGVSTQWAGPESKIEINETGPVTVLVVTD